MATQPLPLAGLRVVDYTHFLAGPYLSRCLAGMGAEVIKVERPPLGDAGRPLPTRLHSAELRDGRPARPQGLPEQVRGGHGVLDRQVHPLAAAWVGDVGGIPNQGGTLADIRSSVLSGEPVDV